MPPSPWSAFDLAWPWIGAIAASLLLIFLFATDRLRGDRAVSRWRDPVWLAWLGAAVYMIHNVEEYGIDLLGRTHAFPDALCTTLGLGAYPACPIPPSFFLAVNISLFWVAAPFAALLSHRHALMGLAIYGLFLINGMIHIAPMIAGRGYNPGALTAAVLFLPLFFWVATHCFGPGRIGYRSLPAIIFTGVLVHIVLMGSALAFVHGMIGGSLLVAIQILNAGLFLFVPWLAGRRLVGRASSAAVSVQGGRQRP